MSSRSTNVVERTIVTPHKVVERTKVVERVIVTRKPNYVVMFTSRSCGPCQSWKRTERHKLIARGIPVVEIEMSDPVNARWSSQVAAYPTFWVCDGESQTRLESLVGFTASDTLAARVTSRTKIRATPRKTVERTVTRTARPARYVQWPGWGTIDLETYSRNCNCPMCHGIRVRQQEYRRQMIEWQSANEINETSPAQEGTPYEVIGKTLDAMRLVSTDVLADPGCGDGRVLIAAALRGITCIGTDRDQAKVDEARHNVAAAGVSHLVTIDDASDARDFDTSRCTAMFCYFYPDLLAELAPKMKSVRVAASVFHEVDGFTQVGDVWIHRRTDYVATR